MFLHRVTIHRPDTSSDFFYSANNVLSNQAYIDMVDAATAVGKIINTSLSLSNDELSIVREATWDDEASFFEFLEEYTTNVFPDYTAEFLSYNTAHNHIGVFESEIS
jgi:hypothetical protein